MIPWFFLGLLCGFIVTLLVVGWMYAEQHDDDYFKP